MFQTLIQNYNEHNLTLKLPFRRLDCAITHPAHPVAALMSVSVVRLWFSFGSSDLQSFVNTTNPHYNTQLIRFKLCKRIVGIIILYSNCRAEKTVKSDQRRRQ